MRLSLVFFFFKKVISELFQTSRKDRVENSSYYATDQEFWCCPLSSELLFLFVFMKMKTALHPSFL